MPGGENGKRKAVLRYPRGEDPYSIKLHQCSILLDDWKNEFCFGSGRAIFSGGTDAEVETPTLRPSDVNNQLIGRDTDAGKDWRHKERDQRGEMVRLHHWLNEHVFEETTQNSVRQGSLFFCHTCNPKSQIWLSNWIIPMRTEGPVKTLALVVVVKDLGGRGGFPFSGPGSWI